MQGKAQPPAMPKTIKLFANRTYPSFKVLQHKVTPKASMDMERKTAPNYHVQCKRPTLNHCHHTPLQKKEGYANTIVQLSENLGQHFSKINSSD